MQDAAVRERHLGDELVVGGHEDAGGRRTGHGHPRNHHGRKRKVWIDEEGVRLGQVGWRRAHKMKVWAWQERLELSQWRGTCEIWKGRAG